MSRIIYRRNGVLISDKTTKQNAEEIARRAAEQKQMEEEYKRTHPEGIERISGCCDRADND